ncbi:S8 family serine peptidase [Flavobacterium faecale]|uniref:S8 family serine peptidase n=1 Tax=Flavobacterium faecale TaxID=1355330 RepID=UPI003AAC0526
MKKTVLLLVLFVSLTAWSQEDAWVYFNAKANEQAYYATPLNMLSQRALDRRIKQNIALDFKDIPMNPSYITQVKENTGIRVLAKSKWLNALHVRGTVSDINLLKALPFVSKVDFADKSLNTTAKTVTVSKSKVESKINSSRVNFAYGTSENQIKLLNGQVLHQQNYTGSGLIIAVMDAGFPGVNTAQPFQRLRENNKILGGYDFVQRSTNFYSGNNHGTYVLSSMGGYKENALIGTAPDASYYLFITEDTAVENPVEQSYWVEAAEKADSLGVDIINTSLGYLGDHTNPRYNHTYEDMTGDATFISKGANIAFSRGMIVVASAGNDGTEAEPHIGSPADAFSVLAVGAVTASGTKAGFSSIGPSFDGRVKPEVMAQGQSTVLSDENGNIIAASGTSFSGPIMAGMVACLWQAFPSKSNQEIKEMIINSADKFSTPSPQYGYGIPNFSLALGLQFPEFEEDVMSAIHLHPNPTASLVKVTFPQSVQGVNVVFYSATGNKVLDQKNVVSDAPISLESLSSGTYIYKLECNRATKTGKIIKL